MKKCLNALLLIFFVSFSYSQTTTDFDLPNLALITNTPQLISKNKKFNILVGGQIKVEKNFDEYQYKKINAGDFFVYDDNGKILRKYSNGAGMVIFLYEDNKLISSIFYGDLYFETHNYSFLLKTDELIASNPYIVNKTKYTYNENKQIINKKSFNQSGEEKTTYYEYDTKGRISKINGTVYEYDENDHLKLMEEHHKDFVLANQNVIYQEGTAFSFENSLLSTTKNVFRSNLKMNIVDKAKGIEKTVFVTPIIHDSYPFLKAQGLLIKIIKSNNKDWQTNSEEKFTYEFNEFGDWITRITHKKNKEGNYTITGGTYREFLSLADIKNQ